MADRRALCLESVVLSEREQATVRSLITADDTVERRLLCRLEADHGHEHAALANTGGTGMNESQWWLRWWPGRRVLETQTSCEATAHEAECDEEPCVILAGHEGGHSFELTAPPHRTPSSVETFYLVDMGRSGLRY